MNIINWNKINTFRGWGRVLVWICHPIETYKRDKNCYGTFVWKLGEFFHDGWKKLLPFAKPSRFLGSELIYRVYDSKLLDTFQCRTRGENTKYYFSYCLFGFVKFYEIVYKRNGKNVNTFMDVFVTTLVDEEQGKKNVEQITTHKRVIYSGWVFTKAQAIKTLVKIIKNNADVYNPNGDNEYAYLAKPHYMDYIVTPLRLILRGCKRLSIAEDITSFKLVDNYVGNTSRVWRLYWYVLHLMSCKNDFQAHDELADICLLCIEYTNGELLRINPMRDTFYYNLCKQHRYEAAKEYEKITLANYNKNKKQIVVQLNEAVENLAKKYMNLPYSYKRV